MKLNWHKSARFVVFCENMVQRNLELCPILNKTGVYSHAAKAIGGAGFFVYIIGSAEEAGIFSIKIIRLFAENFIKQVYFFFNYAIM